MTLSIVTVEQLEYQHVLTQPAEEISFPLKKEEQDLIASMKVKLQKLGGVGLAAPQVNASKRIIAIYIPEEARLLRDHIETTYSMHILINPSYLPAAHTDIQHDFEACYSVSSKAGKVPRFHEIRLFYYDESGQYYEQTERGFYARVLQHEIDHVNGILITDRLTPDCIQGTVQEMMALRRTALPQEKKALFDKIIAQKMAAPHIPSSINDF